MRDGAAIDISQERVGSAAIVRVSGDVDMTGSPRLRDEIRTAQDARPERIVIDLSEVQYMDSSGLATLVEAMKNAKSKGSLLVLCSMHDKVRGIFEIARLDQYFTIVNSTDDALNA